ncbi:MAG: LPS export ABC transporter periplasmic protein LptC [Treponema sp.]|nr:LPS export ABC transporter periplasmic protein LptC [Treponema sp.]
MNNQCRRIIFLCIFISLMIPLFAEKITFSANSMTGKTGDNASETRLVGNAYILTSTLELSADSITLKGKDFRFIQAEGNISGKNLETNMNFSCGNLSFDRKTKLATLKDNVSLTDIENEVTAKAQIIEYNQEQDVAIIQIDIMLTQKNNECSGAYAVYRKKQKMLELSGNAQIRQNEDTFRAQEITLNLDTQEITLDGRVKGSITEKDKSPEENGTESSKDNAASDSSNNAPTTSNTQTISNTSTTSQNNTDSQMDDGELINANTGEKS